MENIELDSKNLKRLYRIFLYRLNKNRKTVLSRCLTFLYLIGCFCFFALYLSYNIRIADKPLGYLLFIAISSGLFLLYLLINHLLLRRILTLKFILFNELLIAGLMICIFISDAWIGN